jgi:hypothetical protein
MGKNVKVTQESDSGRNLRFINKKTGEQMTRAAFVKQIEQGLHPDYHVRKVGDIKTPASNPDGKKNNNLG